MAIWRQVLSEIFVPKIIKIWYNWFSRKCRGCFLRHSVIRPTIEYWQATRHFPIQRYHRDHVPFSANRETILYNVSTVSTMYAVGQNRTFSKTAFKRWIKNVTLFCWLNPLLYRSWDAVFRVREIIVIRILEAKSSKVNYKRIPKLKKRPVKDSAYRFTWVSWNICQSSGQVVEKWNARSLLVI